MMTIISISAIICSTSSGHQKAPAVSDRCYGTVHDFVVEFRTGAIDTDGGWSFLFPQEDLVDLLVSVDAEKSDIHRKGGMTMTVQDLISVLSFGLTCFSIGYAIGVNRPIKK